jgi:hypothetical protein
MRFFKYMNYEIVCIVGSAVVVILATFPARAISGEGTTGGCVRHCYNVAALNCGDLYEGADCHQPHIGCYGCSSRICHDESTEPSFCSTDQYRCKNQPDEECY